jgi:hypothetical protein
MEERFSMHDPEVVTMPVQNFADIKSAAMIIVELSQKIDDIVLPMVEGDERIEFLDTLVISLREHARVLLEKVKSTPYPVK